MHDDMKKPIKTELHQVHTIVEGRVQGVGFRAFAQRKAISLGISGWVRNRWNGTVEVIAEGERIALEEFLSSLRRGPFSGTTTNLTTVWNQATRRYSTFQIRMTG